MNGLRLDFSNGRGLAGIVQHLFFPDNMRHFDVLALNGDAKAFYNAALERGYYDEADIIGTPLACYKEIFLRGRKMVYEYYAQKHRKLAGIALKRFPELERGESIGVSEIRERLKQLRENGYEVKAHSSMKKGELWFYWMHVKQEIRKSADVYCPEVLVEIDEANRRQVEDARSHL